LKDRKAVYDTDTIHKNEVVFWFETDDMNSLEKCIKGILSKFAIRKTKEVYLVGLDKIIHGIKGCARLLTNIICTGCNVQTIPSRVTPSTVTKFAKHFYESHGDFSESFLIVPRKSFFQKSKSASPKNSNQIGGSSTRHITYKLPSSSSPLSSSPLSSSPLSSSSSFRSKRNDLYKLLTPLLLYSPPEDIVELVPQLLALNKIN